MSYLVLARKYRPKNFSEMVGQSHVVQALGNALRAGSDDGIRGALKTRLGKSSALVREHVEWALAI